ncbi:MAG: GDP-mannose 4,6-dehydratase [Promethearchaeota archaeon]
MKNIIITMKNIIITGANGFLGSHLVDFLVEKKEYNIHALVRPHKELKNLNHYLKSMQSFKNDQSGNKKILIETIKDNLFIHVCDIKNRTYLSELIQTVEPYLIFHFAAQSRVIPSWNDPFETIETNVIGTLNIFEPLKKHEIKSRVIVACSSAEYGTTTSEIKRPLREEDPLKAIHPYGISKIATELLARQYYINFGIESVILRFFNQTGPRKKHDACSDFISKIVQIELGLIEPILEVGNLNPFRDITGIKDSIQAIWLTALKGKPGETYNVCSGKKIQIREILNQALKFSTKRIQVKENTPKKLRKTDEDVIWGDNTKIKRKVGWNITQSLEELLKDMFEYWMDYYKERIN